MEAEALGARVGELEAAGAPPARIKRAAERRDAAIQQVKIAGGPTSKSLLWQIKDEEAHIERLDKSAAKERSNIEGKAREIARLQGEMEAGQQLLARLEDKRREAVERLRYLSQQKWVESIPAEWVANFRELAQALGESNHHAYPMLRTLVELMVPPSTFHLAEGDTESDDNATVLEDADCDAAPSACTGAESRLAEAEGLLETLRSRRTAAVANAQAARLASATVGTKRALGEDGQKSRDADGDTEMVPPLTMDQASALHRDQLEQVAADVARLRREEAKEVVPVVSSHAAATVHGQQDLAPQSAEASGPSTAEPSGSPQPLARRGALGRMLRRGCPPLGPPGDGGPTSRHRWSSAEGRDADRARGIGATRRPASLGPRARRTPTSGASPPGTTLIALREEVANQLSEQRAATERLVERVECNARILEQEALQQQQDREVARVEAVTRAKLEIEAAVAARAAGNAQPLLVPVYGPTGQRLDDQQRTMLALAPPPRGRAERSPGEEHDVCMASSGDGGAPHPARRGRGRRWEPPAEVHSSSADRGNSRSLRPAARRRGPYW